MIYYDILVLYYAFTKMVPPHIMTGSMAGSMIGSTGDLGFNKTSYYFIMLLLIWSHHTS